MRNFLNVRYGIALLLMLGGIACLSQLPAQGPLAPPGPPAPTMKTLQQLSDQVASLSSLTPTQKFTGYGFLPAPPAAGGKSCIAIPIAAGQLVRLESLVVDAYTDPNAVAYLRYFIKESAGISRIAAQAVALGPALSDPVANTRTGVLQIPMWIGGGGVADVQISEVHSPFVCIQSSPGQNATGTFVLTGTYVSATGGAAPPAPSRATTESNKLDKTDPTLQVEAPAPPKK